MVRLDHSYTCCVCGDRGLVHIQAHGRTVIIVGYVSSCGQRGEIYGTRTFLLRNIVIFPSLFNILSTSRDHFSRKQDVHRGFDKNTERG